MSERLHIKCEVSEESVDIWDEQRGQYVDVDYLKGRTIEYAERLGDNIVLILEERS